MGSDSAVVKGSMTASLAEPLPTTRLVQMIEPFVHSLKQPLNRTAEKLFLYQVTPCKRARDPEKVALKPKARKMISVQKSLKV